MELWEPVCDRWSVTVKTAESSQTCQAKLHNEFHAIGTVKRFLVMAVMKFIILGSFWLELLGGFHSRRLYICRLKLGTGVIFIGKSKMAGQNFCGAASSQAFFSWGRPFPCGFGLGIPISRRESARVRGTRCKICWVWETGAWDYINNFLGFPIQSRISFG